MKRKRYPEKGHAYCEDELPPANILKEIIELGSGSTYSPNILARRVNLLTEKERLACDKKWNKIAKLINGIDEIISKRAEVENDPWKIIKPNERKQKSK